MTHIKYHPNAEGIGIFVLGKPKSKPSGFLGNKIQKVLFEHFRMVFGTEVLSGSKYLIQYDPHQTQSQCLSLGFLFCENPSRRLAGF